mmetsp:Transcript_19149/g.53756  ORF Transcript_19149/g.53756 Transcript_19149/m.53756 type:complete len:219 (+) Transcript_19149:107-763(+)
MLLSVIFRGQLAACKVPRKNLAMFWCFVSQGNRFSPPSLSGASARRPGGKPRPPGRRVPGPTRGTRTSLPRHCAARGSTGAPVPRPRGRPWCRSTGALNGPPGLRRVWRGAPGRPCCCGGAAPSALRAPRRPGACCPPGPGPPRGASLGPPTSRGRARTRPSCYPPPPPGRGAAGAGKQSPRPFQTHPPRSLRRARAARAGSASSPRPGAGGSAPSRR